MFREEAIETRDLSKRYPNDVLAVDGLNLQVRRGMEKMEGNRPTLKFFVKRSRMDIVSSIVKLCRDPILKTHIMYKANLSYTQLNGYLEFLLRVDLITKERNDYRITEKGAEFIREYKRIKKLLRS